MLTFNSRDIYSPYPRLGVFRTARLGLMTSCLETKCLFSRCVMVYVVVVVAVVVVVVVTV